MKIETVSLADLKPPKRNVRVHPEHQITELGRSIDQFGQIRPVVIDEDNTVLAGNGLVEAYRRRGDDKVDALRMSGLSAAQKTKLMLADNKLFALGLDDHEGILEAIRGLDADFDIPGFDADILRDLTFDTSIVTDTALGSYGVLPDGVVAAAQAREVGEGSTEAPQSADDTADDDDAVGEELAEGEIRCPNCGHVFEA